MNILGLKISRARAPAEHRSFYDTIAAWRGAMNFTNVASPGFGLANPWEAMGVPVVYACVDKVAKTIATLPKHIFDIRDPDRARHVIGSPLAQMVHAKPNLYQVGFGFWHLVMARTLLWGNFYAEIQRDLGTGEAIGLWPLLNQDVSVELKAGQKVYRVGGTDMPDQDMFHVMAPSFNGLSGVSLIAMHRSAVNTSVMMQQFTEGFYANGTKLAGSLNHPGELGTDASRRLRENFNEAYAGGGNAGKVAILEEGMTFQPFTMPLGDAEFVDTQRLQIAQVARIFDVPLHKLAEMDGAKYNNVEQQNLSFVIDCIEPWIARIVQEANAKLFATRRQGRFELRIPTDQLLRGDLESRFKAFASARQWGLMTINEVRAKLGLPNIGPEGDQLFASGNANGAAPAPTLPLPTDPVDTTKE